MDVRKCLADSDEPPNSTRLLQSTYYWNRKAHGNPGCPWAEYGKDLPSAEGLSPGIVCREETPGSWKESTKINSSSSQGSRFSYKTEIFSLLSPRRSWSGYKCLTLIRKTLLVSSQEVNAPVVLAGRWGLQKENSGLVSEHSSGMRDCFPLSWCLLSQ